MSFPNTPLGMITELEIDGAWQDISGDVYNRDAVSIERGRPDEASSPDPGRLTLTLNNRAGKYSPRNPRSPYFGKIGRNTPIRFSAVPETPHLVLPGGADTAASATTPDTAALDITGDLDVRVDAELSNWLGTGYVEIVGKSQFVVGRRSWTLMTKDNRVHLEWSADGTNVLTADSTVPPPVANGGRLAVRATLDVDNGAGGWSVRFYTAPTLAGPWAQLGATVTGTGVTSIFNSPSALGVGNAEPGLNFANAAGKLYALEVRAGIDGTPVANPTFDQPAGTTAFTDPAGRPWTVAAQLKGRYVRFEGEVSAWPMSWAPGGADSWVELVASGVTRRYGQGSKPLLSALRRRIEAFAPLAYWPLEDEEGATKGFTPIEGALPADTVNFGFGSAEGPGGSAELADLSSTSYLDAQVPYYKAGSGSVNWCVEFVYRVPDWPSSDATFLRLRTDGTVTRHVIMFGPSGLTFRGYRTDPNEGLSSEDIAYNLTTSGSGAVGSWNRMRLIVTEVSPAVAELRVYWTVINGGTGTTSTTFVGRGGRITRIYNDYSTAFGGSSIGHLVAHNADTHAAFDYADHGYVGETGQDRMARIAAGAGVPLSITAPEGMTPMGSQRPDTLLGTLENCASTDGGLLAETRQGRGLYYQSRTTLYNKAPALDITYAETAPGLLPIEDDQGTRNDVTAKRTGGSQYRAQQLEGPMSVQDPPVGVGRYDAEVTANPSTDEALKPMAEWAVHLGTYEGARYPTLALDMLRTPHLIPQVGTLDLLDRVRVSDLPDWLPPDPIDVLAQGYRETLSLTGWTLELNGSPYTPWEVGAVEDRADTDGSELLQAADADDTTLYVTVTDGPLWTTDPAQFPFEVTCGGEVVTVSAIAPYATDPFTRTVSSGWGSTPSGVAWNWGGGAAADYSVDGALGRHSLGSINVSRYTVLNATFTDFDISATAATSVLATGAPHYVHLVGRLVDTSNVYSARLVFNTNQTVALELQKRLAGAQTTLATVPLPSLTHAANARFWIRFKATGSELAARAWASGGTEPNAWQVTTTDTDLTAGAVGARSALGTGNTNTLPVAATFDSFTVNGPQIFTVTRGTGGVAVAHAAGTDVRLTHPARVSW